MNKIDKRNLTETRLDQITKWKITFTKKLIKKKKKIRCKKLGKFTTSLDYIDKVLIVPSATSGGVCLYVICKCCWCTDWNSRSKFYFNVFLWQQE